MNRLLLNQGLVVTVTFLFIGFAFIPVINAYFSKEPMEDEFIEFPVEIYGPEREVHQVRINEEKIKEIEQLIDLIKKQIENIKSPDEADDVFNKAVLQLHEHGLIPDDMSIEEAQQLVNGGYDAKKALLPINRIVERNQLDIKNFNIFCRVGGAVEAPLFVGMFGKIFYTFCALWYTFWNWIGFPIYWTPLLALIIAPLEEIQLIRPLHIGHRVYIGYKWDDDWAPTGWVNSIGLLGIRKWEGELRGCIPINFGPLEIWMYPAILGFVGYKIPTDIVSQDEFFFIGFALLVGIENA